MFSDGLDAQVHQFCWVDLATADEAAAKSFYGGLFGWTVQDRRSGEGRFSTFAHRDAPFASLYQLSRRQIDQGVPSHWTPYLSTRDVDAVAAKAADLGGQIIVPPHDATGFARISLIADPTGALFGLWQEQRHKF
jgi:predicted enzyme related to lactoylglutathione lyase